MARDELNTLSAFLVVAEERSFTRAAGRLEVSPSALSHAIRRLEERIGVRLLARTTRSVAPTEAGEQLISRLRPALGDVESVLDQIVGLRERPAGRVRLLDLGVVAQGDKQVLLGGESIDYGPGQSMLTTIDLPVVSHVTRASVREPFLGMMLTLDVRSIVQLASEMDEPRRRREDAYRSISFEALDAALLDALVRLVAVLDEPALVPRLAPLIQQE